MIGAIKIKDGLFIGDELASQVLTYIYTEALTKSKWEFLFHENLSKFILEY